MKLYSTGKLLVKCLDTCMYIYVLTVIISTPSTDEKSKGLRHQPDA
jgi:hypothetical protein